MKTRLVFTGDITFNKYFRDGWRRADCVQKEVDTYLQSADYVIGNIEGPLTQENFNRVNSQVHSSPPEAGSFLRQHNISIWNLGNNHMMDCGEKGLLETMTCAKDNGCRIVGAGRTLDEAREPLLLGNVGIISIAKPWQYIIADEKKAGAFTWDKTTLLADSISLMREKVKWVVLIVHGGDEFSNLPVPEVRNKYHGLLDLGADIIIGHHPHVVQPYERVQNKIIVYSLGNFIFDTDYQREFKNTDIGILFGIDFDEDAYTYNHLTIHINREKELVELGGETPIFTEIGPTEYDILWPIEAKSLYNINKKKWIITQRRFKRTSSFLGSLHMLYGLKHKNNRTIFKGKMKSYLGKRKLSTLSGVRDYLIEQQVEKCF